MAEWSHQLDTWIVVVGALCAMACALLGNFLLLRRMSMMGDAISHAVLPGLAAAFLLTGARTSGAMFIGAAVVGVLTALFTQWVHGFGRVDRGASMGVVFTALFAVGLILIERGAQHVDLDAECVLYGEIVTVVMDRVSIGGWMVPRPALVLAGVLLLNGAVVTFLHKELKISSFDPALATTLGINATFMHYLLMTLVAITTVASFEAIGSILVIAMLIVPPATAHLLTDRLWPMIGVSLLVAAASAALGHVSAITVPTWFGFTDTVTAGMMAAAAGAIFLVVMLLAPRHGVLSKLIYRVALSRRILCEDVLGLLWRLEELNAEEQSAMAPSLLRRAMGVGPITSRLTLAWLRMTDRVRRAGRGYRLTEMGREEAASLVRSHRLWEAFLAKHLGLAADHLHRPAERLEHITAPAMQQALARETLYPARDPHGKPVPQRDEHPPKR